MITRSSSHGSIVWTLSENDQKKFNALLLRLEVSCVWVLSCVNKPEAKEFFNFLNPSFKLPDCHVLGGTVLLTSEGKLYIWKAYNVSSECETYIEVMNKTKMMLTELKDKEVNVSAESEDGAVTRLTYECTKPVSNVNVESVGSLIIMQAHVQIE
ncbi:24357_t:CDS:2 [Entrophospora sp. SA101]|nr:10644_t:CDS:2 [Entrophospora sp. SA101]CAJ0751991.1 24357_t:CDS:2 [Entrophospora sp. SA101]CAJ0824521.1 9442_t:CDS:2 [Entrophospora sp. SA101]